MRMSIFRAMTVVLIAAGVAHASGVMIPVKPGLPPLAIKYQRVSVEIDNQVARTTVAQSFINSTNRPLEATYIFPLPKGASVSDFSMLINGKVVKGELLDAAKARKIYQDIVNRMKDPGLLEYLGSNLFKASVFPVPPNSEQKVELKYSQIVPRDAGICKYVYPLKIDEKASRTLEDFSVAVTIRSKEAIKTVYSPTHKIGVTRKDDHTAVAGFEQAGALLDKDFVLYYSLSDKDFGVNLLTYRDKGEDGYFMVLVSPRTEIKQSEIIAKDVCFVVDTSGSMNGQKMQQVKEALKYCVKNLNAKDRFNIIRFSTAVDPFEAKPVDANAANVERAVAFIDKFEAVGGTNIDGALKQALEGQGGTDRPYTVVFLTDGLPTQGETTDPKQIVANCKARAAKNVRMFSFGVGYDVNTHLLDSLSSSSRGLTTYVKPGENIEEKVSTFHNKANYPVLADLALDAGNVKLRDMYPQQMPDLFKGSQLIVLGRYREDGHVAIRLKGSINGNRQEFVYESTFPTQSSDNEFIRRLWATRKVGYLLDQIRLHGEKPELRGEVVTLAKKFGIVTPYTSYLVVPDEVAVATPRREFGRGGRDGRVPTPVAPGIAVPPLTIGAGGPMPDSAPADRSLSADGFKRLKDRVADLQAERSRLIRSADWDEGRTKNAYGAPAMKADTGKAGVRIAELLDELKRADKEQEKSRIGGMRLLGPKTFYLVEGVWTDVGIDEKAEEIKIKFGSDAYLTLIENAPRHIRQWLTIGDKTTLMLPNGKRLTIGDEGTEKLTKEEAAKLFEK